MRIARAFRVDRAEGKVAGVCAGLADLTGIDVTIVRVALVVLTIAGGFPWTLLAYGLAAWLGQPEAAADDGARIAADERNADLERRLREVEAHVANPNERLAREIESLR